MKITRDENIDLCFSGSLIASAIAAMASLSPESGPLWQLLVSLVGGFAVWIACHRIFDNLHGEKMKRITAPERGKIDGAKQLSENL
jgi:hypothetical protein